MEAARIKVSEEHSSTLVQWYAREVKSRTVVYLDAHLDLQYISDSRLERLGRAGNADEIRALEKQDHLLADGDTVFGIENWLYAAKHLGLIDRLIWVAPPHVDISYSERVLEHVQQMDGVTLEEILSLEKSPSGYYFGRLLGLDLTVCNVEHLSDLTLPGDSLIDIDADFFIDLPRDRPWTSPERVYSEVIDAVPDPELVTIARSVSSGFMPMRYAFIADYLDALFQQDEILVDHHRNLFSWFVQGADDAALDRELERFPHCATSHFLKWTAAKETAPAAHHKEQAIRHSPPYASDPVRKLCGRLNRRLPVAKSHLRDVARAASVGGETAQRALIALGLAMSELGRAQEAYACLRQLDTPHPALATAVAGLIGDGDAALKRTLLRLGSEEDASATRCHLTLAELAQRQGDLDNARRHLALAHSRCPGWLMPLERLARLDSQADRAANSVYRRAADKHRRLLQDALASSAGASPSTER